MNSTISFNTPSPWRPDIQLHGDITLKPDTSYVSSPSITSIFFLVPYLIHTIRDIKESLQIKNKQSFRLSLINALHLPFGIAASIEKIISFIAPFFAFIIGATLILTSLAFSFIFLGFQVILELIRMVREIYFALHFAIGKALVSKDPSIIKKALLQIKYHYCSLTKETLNHLEQKTDYILGKNAPLQEKEDFYQRSAKVKLNSQLENLAKLIRPWATKTLYESNVDSLNQSEARELLQKIDMQIKRSILVYALGLIAMIIAITVLSLFTMGLPLSLLFIVTLTGFVLECVRYFAQKPLLDIHK